MQRSVVAISVLLALMVGPPAGTASAQTYAETPVPTWVPNAPVRSMAVTTSRIYLGGDFTSLTNPFTGATMVRNHLVAIDRATGNPVVSWHPDVVDVDGVGAPQISTLEIGPSETLIVGGVFGSIDGDEEAEYLAGVTASGAVDDQFAVVVDGPVTDLVRDGDDLYLAGDFTEVGGVTRHSVARVDALSGAPDPAWDPNVTVADVRQVAVAPDTVYLAGVLVAPQSLDDSWLASVDTATGVNTGWTPELNCPIVDSTADQYCHVTDLTLDDDRVYVAVGTGLRGAVLAWRVSSLTPERLWADVTDLDVEALEVYDGRLYAGGRFSYVKEEGGSGPRINRSVLATIDRTDGDVLAHSLSVTSPYSRDVFAVHADSTGLYLGGRLRLTNSPFQRFVVLPAPRAVIPGPNPPVTKVKVNLKGCKTCKVRLTQHRGAEGLWNSGWTKAKRGTAVFAVPTSRTVGLTATVKAPWEKRYKRTTEVVMRYKGEPVGSQVTLREASRAKRASSCYAGTNAKTVTFKVRVSKLKVGASVRSRAWITKTHKFRGPTRRAPRGVLSVTKPTRCT